MKNKKAPFYKIIRILTLAVPVPVYLFLTATLFSITPDFKIENIKAEDLSIVEIAEDNYFIYDTTYAADYTGKVVFHDEFNIHGIYINGEDIIRVGRGYYSYIKDEKTNTYNLVDIKKLEIQKQTGYKLPAAFFISLFGVVIVVLVIQRKLSWHRKHPKAAVLIGLTTGTIILYILNTVIGGILGVFTVATISWALFLLEELIANGNIKDDVKTNDVLDALKKALE